MSASNLVEVYATVNKDTWENKPGKTIFFENQPMSYDQETQYESITPAKGSFSYMKLTFERLFNRVKALLHQRKEIKAITLQEAAKKQARAIVNRRFAHRQAVLQGYVHKSMLVADGKGHNTLQGIPQKP